MNIDQKFGRIKFKKYLLILKSHIYISYYIKNGNSGICRLNRHNIWNIWINKIRSMRKEILLVKLVWSGMKVINVAAFINESPLFVIAPLIFNNWGEIF